jgi:hypothetical protein
MESLDSLFRTRWDHEPGRRVRRRESVLKCGSPLLLSSALDALESARGLAQSKTWRHFGRFLERRLVGILPYRRIVFGRAQPGQGAFPAVSWWIRRGRCCIVGRRAVRSLRVNEPKRTES